MRQIVKLYLGDMEVEFNQPPEILYTYTQDELTNPTILKNSFSKTITIEGTKQNNKIFGHFWNLERIQDYGAYTGVYFNASKKTPFKLYVNGDIYESGYAKLTEVRKERNGIEYDIDLYGGLGQFFYGLTNSNTTGSKLKLSDLEYMNTDNSETEFNFIVDKNTIYDAWYGSTPSAPEGNFYHYINFVPAYNGVPSKDFDSNKVLINCKNAPINIYTKADAEGKPVTNPRQSYEYRPYSGEYVYAELADNLTEWEMADLRSGYQRPAIRMKEIINACERYMAKPENGGWVVDKDAEFFNSDNPYWEDTWMTLPMLADINYVNDEEIVEYHPTISITKSEQLVNRGLTRYTINGIDEKVSKVTISAKYGLNSFTNTFDTLYPSQCVDYNYGGFLGLFKKKGQKYYDGAIVMRLEAVNSLGNVIAATDWACLTNGTYNGNYAWYLANDNTAFFNGGFSSAVINYAGYFKKFNNKFFWVDEGRPENPEEIVFELDLQGRSYSSIRLSVFWKCNSNINLNTGVLYSQPVYKNNSNQDDVRVRTDAINYENPELAFINSSTISGGKSLSGKEFNKKQILDTQYTPADYLISYCKLFNLHFIKDVDSNTIHILTRKNFYQGDNVVDLEKLIDRSKEIKVTPQAFDKQWYDFKLPIVDGSYAKDYRITTSYDYGIKRINTGYDFDGSAKDLLTGNAFKSAIEVVEKSKYFSYVGDGIDTDTDNGKQPWMLDGLKYNLYGKTDSTKTVEMTIEPENFYAQSISDFQKYYDLFGKLQLHQDNNNAVDGSNVLVFFNGYQDLVSPNAVQLNYWITDDLPAMTSVGGNSCWLYTNVPTNADNETIAIKVDRLPKFERYRMNGYNIAQSLDFGEPRQLYIPHYQTRENSTIYYNYWDSYIADMYDVNTRVLECYVRLEDKPNPEWLRRFYWWDNSLWRINKIEDWNISSFETSKMQFIKVQDIAHYTNNIVSNIATISIVADRTTIPDVGGTVTFTVTVSDGGCWTGDDSWEYYFGTIPRGCGDTTFSMNVPPFTDGRVLRLNVCGEQDQWGQGVEIKQESVVLTVNEIGEYATRNVPQNGGTCYYTVKSSYPWTVVSDNPYCVPQTISGTGNTTDGETIEVVWSPSDSFNVRSATLTFTDSKGNVIGRTKTQDGVNYYNLHYPYSGGTLTIYADSGATVSTKPEWITIVDNEDSSYTVVAEYNNEDYRNGTIALSYDNGRIFTVIAEQDENNSSGGSTGNTKYLNVKQFAQYALTNVPQTGGTCLYNVKSTSPWIVSSDSPYCTPQTVSGTGNTTVGETIEVVWTASDSYFPRTAILTFSNTEGYTVQIEKKQDGLTYMTLNYPATGETKTIQFESGASVQTKPDWITINDIGGNEYELIASENMSYERSSIIVMVGSSTLTISVTQAESEDADVAKKFQVTPMSLYYESSGGSQFVQIINNMGNNWRITSIPSWITVSQTQSSGSAVINVQASENTGSSARTDNIVLYNATNDRTYNILCSQSSVDSEIGRSITITPNPASIGNEGGELTVQITYTNRNGDFLIPSTTGVTVGNVRFTGDTSNVKINVPENTTFSAKTYTVIFNGDGISSTLTINQDAATPYLEVIPTSLNFGVSGGTADITINTNDNWTIE